MGLVIIITILVVIVFIFVTGKSRRAGVMSRAIQQLAKSGSKQGMSLDIYYEAAKKFALESGAEPSLIDDNSGSFFMEINNVEYIIYISRQRNGSTYLGVTKAAAAKKEFADMINKFS